MKKYNNIKKIFEILTFAAVFSFGTVGCKDKRADSGEIAENIEGITDNNGATNSDSSDEGGTKHLDMELETANGIKITVDADVESPSSDIPVYSVREIPYDDAMLEGIAGKVFDDGEYTLRKPYAYCDLDELNAEADRYGELFNENSVVGPLVMDKCIELDNAINNYDAANVLTVPEGQLFLETYFDIEYDDLEGQNVELCTLAGNVDGVAWELYSLNCEGNEITEIYPEFQREPIMDYAGVGDQFQIYGENRCTYSEEDAEELAAQWIDEMGYENMRLIHTSETQTIDNEDNVYLNGYSFIYGFSFDNIQQVYTYYRSINYDSDDFVEQGYIEIYVTSDGIQQITMRNMFQLVNEEVSNVQLLDFDTVNDMAAEYVRKINMTKGVDIVIHSIELKYLIEGSDSGEGKLIPVWLYVVEQDNGNMNTEYSTIAFMVNAIDGSIIDSDE